MKRTTKKYPAHCPNCREELEPHANYAPWCYECNWNVSPNLQAQSELTHINPKRINSWCRRANQKLLARVTAHQANNLAEPPSGLKGALTVAVLLVYVCTSALAATGWFLLLRDAPTLLQSIFGAGLGVGLIAATAWSIWPRLEEYPPDEVIADSTTFPALNQIVADIAEALDVEKPAIIITEHFDASFGRIDWRRRPVLMIGHPFLAVLEPEEIVGLIAHELSHDRDRSIKRTLLAQVAFRSVWRWEMALHPWRFSDKGMLLWPLRALMSIGWLPAKLMLDIMNVLMRREGHEAEYAADRLALTVSGNVKTESLMRKSLYRFSTPLVQTYLKASPVTKHQVILAQLNRIPAREFERLWRIANLTPADTLDQTHPPIQNRLAFVNSVPVSEPKVVISAEAFEAIQQELIKWPIVIHEREVKVMAEFHLRPQLPESNVAVPSTD